MASQQSAERHRYGQFTFQLSPGEKKRLRIFINSLKYLKIVCMALLLMMLMTALRQYYQ